MACALPWRGRAVAALILETPLNTRSLSLAPIPLVVAALAVLAPGVVPLLAQSPVVVPALAVTSSSGDYRDVSMFYGGTTNNRAHTQALYATSEVGLRTGTIHGLRFRRSSFQSGPARDTILVATIEMSVSPVSPMAPSTFFDANHGPNRTVVFQGTLNLTGTPASTPWPAPWEAPVVFQTPFAYDGNAGQSLVIDIQVAGNSRVSSWHASCVTVAYGTVATERVDVQCTTFGEDRISGSFGFQQFQPMLGGSFSLSHLGFASRPSFQYSWLLIGFSATGSLFGRVPLPVSLNSIGLPADPDCMLAVQPDLIEAMSWFPGQGGSPGAIAYGPIQLPGDPAWLGQNFYTQSMSLDYDNTGMTEPWFFPSLALRWTFGSGVLPTASKIVRISDPIVPSPQGTPTIGEAPVFELDLR